MIIFCQASFSSSAQSHTTLDIKYYNYNIYYYFWKVRLDDRPSYWDFKPFDYNDHVYNDNDNLNYDIDPCWEKV